MTFHVETKLKRGDKFVSIEDWSGIISDPQYIEGVVVMSYQGQTLMGEDFWDDVNYMWPYLLNGLPEIAQGKNWSTRFPDQPITFSVEHIAPDWLLLHVYAEDEEYVKKKIPKCEYLSEMARAGRDFLSRLYRICQAADMPFEHYARLLDELPRT
ncbi:hypothetical protein [Pseudoduganella chitinolytica]|uniref:DUF402 domain-containing protein n=1 Tax=Pseudoduganella chitinolytica TaxID=34070 RepID=A0ABY8BGJ3_9BURK|nr:hypothetical protein [Pseudoduganella chitinolytica]WEF34093.1 hypothetical protein PX653_04790 [Pseudoduganella chitinolytica]